PRTFSRSENKRVPSSTDLHFIVLQVKFFRNADGLAIAALENLRCFHDAPCTYIRIYASAVFVQDPLISIKAVPSRAMTATGVFRREATRHTLAAGPAR